MKRLIDIFIFDEYRDILREKGYYDDDNIIIEEKKSDNPRIDKLLKTAC